MERNDSELIKRTLEGDQQAYASLVEKYQEQIHALAWQKIGDFHIAQEITQDAFITAYQKLNSLKNPQRFAGWLYVITTNMCNMWHRKKKPQPESLEQTDPMELEELYYSEYVSHEREEDRREMQRSLVKRLLNKLKESDRTVLTLHYLAELSCEEIGEFLGVSTNTVKSRLHRARNRLRGEEALIQENLSSFQLPKQFSENIMKKISNLSPAAPSASKPVMPWIVSSASAIIVFLLVGIGAKQLIRFQQPFSLDADAEQTIEITEAKQVIDSPEKPAIRNQIGRSDVPAKNHNAANKPNAPTADTSHNDADSVAQIKTISQEGATSISGRVIDGSGEIIPGLTLTIKPLERNQDNQPKPITEWKQVTTDKQGAFTFTNINPGKSQFVLLPEGGADYSITSLKIGDVTLYPPGVQPYRPDWLGKITFAVEEHIPLQDIVVTVKPPPMRIRGRILLRDGTPLASSQVNLVIKQRHRETFLYFFTDSVRTSTLSTFTTTDSQGYFVEYIIDTPFEKAEFAVNVDYQGATAKSRWFRMEQEQRYDKLVFRLRGTKEQKKKQEDYMKALQSKWSVNPENGHAYRRIQCDSWDDAKAKADAENAYLVTINDEDEQKWLESRFTNRKFFWIGLRSTQEGTFQKWHNGDPLTYTNWLRKDVTTNDANTPVALDFFSKRWIAFDSKNQFLPLVVNAILEKEDIKIKGKK